ncbi:enoyl-CoA hydratase/isomerase family protein [Corynebacterium uropygiale]|uniref:Enoyl-CoA hydratase/isomerase family protein n=1 Tax=Corynebacterium uropygiale TaxID=1775911 RepID=A0A9X1U197_9CORY|nr:enoyl-CoA hydratase/isomerase family protein [Corynebacterium uropygiale]MCF4007669.1 enoyl-CoA hydratase/isomerase family protein [Corynebacterium uropygiale]
MTALPPSGEALRISQEEGYVLARLHRPEVRNAIDETMVREFHQLCEYLEREPAILVITGCTVNGKGIFASGADIRQLRERRTADALRGVNSTLFHRIKRLPMPVIAAIDGYALGGGLELALAADFRIATEGATFGQPETGLGIIAGAGALWRLTTLVGEGVANEILMAGRRLSAAEALRHGLLTEVTTSENLLDAAAELARRIGKNDPLAVRLSKELLAMPESAHPAVDALAQAICFESPEKFRRMDAFLERKHS